MDVRAVIDRRLTTQGLVGPGFASPELAVSFLTAVQSQEFAAAKWALGERCRGTVDSDIQRAFDDGRILRTHILRPTWHFITPADIGWMLRLTSPHVKRLNAGYLRKQGVESSVLVRCQGLIAANLDRDQYLTKTDILNVLLENGIEMTAFQLGFVILETELDGLICSGPMRGKQHTYALLDERVSGGRDLDGEDALAELTRRYFRSHGPSTEREFARWSGLTLTKVRWGLAMVASELESAEGEGHVHWFDGDTSPTTKSLKRAFLFHEYDECYLSYPHVNFPDHPPLIGIEQIPNTFIRPVIINGRRVGLWRRTVARKTISIELLMFGPLDADRSNLLDEEVARIGAFHGMPATIASMKLLTA